MKIKGPRDSYEGARVEVLEDGSLRMVGWLVDMEGAELDEDAQRRVFLAVLDWMRERAMQGEPALGQNVIRYRAVN